MEVCETARELHARLARVRSGRVGLFATMGSLHRGHAEVITQAASACSAVVVSVFVNPLQFGPNEDFAAYPRNLERDVQIAEEAGANIVFAPTVGQMYGDGVTRTRIHVEKLGEHLCGARRPGHFDGVCTVVAKLFHIVQPDIAYFSKKDAQQLRVVRKMTADLSFAVCIEAAETVRDTDGLALSSRNAYLTPAERAQAPMLYRSLTAAQAAWKSGVRDADALISRVRELLATAPLMAPEYIEIVDDEELQPLTHVQPGRKALLAAAVHLGRARLIDNVELG
jgi:pantoate--beta-alanine ligase